MKTIVEPERLIYKLWGKQLPTEKSTYRLMKYVLQISHEGYTLLHNVVTGQLVVLEPAEVKVLNKASIIYEPEMEQLITDHYLVREDYNEYQKVIGLQRIMHLLNEKKEHLDITHYTILPTIACNARCYYCFEQGVKPVTMTVEIADKVVEYIGSHCGEKKKIRISWFGGEPTVATKQIDQICSGLQNKGIEYRSNMTTNGYLFDREMVERAKRIWNLDSVMICVDGVGDNYNRTKAFVDVHDDPYQRVMRNIELLLSSEIRVDLRMNFDIGNYTDFEKLVQEAVERYKGSEYLQLRAHPIVGAYSDYQGLIRHGSEEWFSDKVVELLTHARKAGLLENDIRLPHLEIGGCQATSDSSVTITPQGNLVRCPEQFGDDQIIGNVTKGITNYVLVEKWKEIGYYDKCKNCTIFPCCVKIKNCAVKDLCCHKMDLINQFHLAMKKAFTTYKKYNDLEEDIS